MRTRSNELELLDDPDVRPEDLLASLNFMRQVNQTLGGARVILDYFESRETPAAFRVLDLGCGAGDIPNALADWAKERGKRISVTAVDLNPLCVAYAARNFGRPEVEYREGSAFALDSLGAYDYTMSSMFFHHLDDVQIVALLKKMRQNSRRGFVVNDLYRGFLNYAGAYVLGVFSFQPIVFNDAKLSVKRAFRELDFKRYAQEAGIQNYRLERKPVFRISFSVHA